MNETNIRTASNSRIRHAVFCLYFCSGICFPSWASRIPDIKTSLGLGDAGGALITIGLFSAVALPHFVTTIISFMVIGFGTAGIVPTIYSVAGQRTRIPTSIALTIVSSVSFLGFLMGPPLIGYISSVTNLRYSYALIGLFGICIVVLASIIRILKVDKR